MNTNLVEQYISQSPRSKAQVDAARKAFKAELRNGPTKPVYFSNGWQTFTSQKACGNFDFILFHKAYDADLDAAGLLVYFEDSGLVKRSAYADLKLKASLNGIGECAKYAKELWALQYGNSDYKLINVPASAKPLTPEEILNKLAIDDMMLNIFKYSLADITFVNSFNVTYKNCLELFLSWFPDAEKLDSFLRATHIDQNPYELVKKSLCSMFLCMIAAEQVLQKAIATNRGFANSVGDRYHLDSITVEQLSSPTACRIYFIFSPDKLTGKQYWLRIALRQSKLTMADNLLDMPVYAALGDGRYYNGKTADIPFITKFSDITFDSLEEVSKTYF